MAPKAVEAEQKGGKSRAEKKPVKTKAEKKPVKEGGKKKKAKSTETYKIYIYKVLKQVSVFFPPSFYICFYGGLKLYFVSSLEGGFGGSLVHRFSLWFCSGSS